MTSPGPDDTTRRLAAAATATGADRPQLATALANSDLSHPEMQAVGGFVDALSLSVARSLAQNSGAATNFTAAEKNQLAGIGEQVADEDTSPDSRSWLEKATDWAAGALSNTGNALLHNPVTHGLLEGMDWLGNAAHMPFRLASDALDSSNNDEINSQMQAHGYDPNSESSYLAFMFEHGESQYHDLTDVRHAFGDDNVDLALKALSDPEQFSKDWHAMDPAAAQAIQTQLESAEFKDAVDAVDRKHISPGRDLARLLLPAGDPTKSGFFTEDGAAFTALSGSLDAAYDWFSDPTLILGKANKIVKAADVLGRDASPIEKILTSLPGQANRRAGLVRGADAMTDQAGIEALLRTENGQAVTKVGKAWQQYLADAADLRAAEKAGDEAKRTGIYSVMQSRYGVLMDLLPEINGARVIPDTAARSGYRLDDIAANGLINKGDAITDLDTLTKHLVSTNGLLRLNNGMAAREAVVMPGRLSYFAERKAAADARNLLGRKKASATTRWIDYADKNGKFIPNEAEQKLIDEAGDPEAVRAGLAQHRQVTRTSLLPTIEAARAARAKVERVGRRFRTQLPTVERLDLTDPASGKVVENIARTYLNRGDAAKLASAYALAPDLAGRRAIVRGALVQSFHASGLSRSEAGRAFMRRYIDDQAALERQQYGYAKTSEILTDRGPVQAALYPDQLSKTVVLPSMREMNYLATKYAVAGFAGRTGLAHVRAVSQSNGMDALMGRIKLGWITSAAGGLRNALDEIANFGAYGMGKDVLAARVAFTKATKDARDLRRAASVERRGMIRRLGRTEADDRIALQLGDGAKSYEDAKLMAERAVKAKAAVDAVPEQLAQRVKLAAARIDDAKDLRYRALDELEQGKAAALPEDQLAVLRERAEYAETEHARAHAALARHKKATEKAGDIQAKIQEGFDKKGVLSVEDAAAELKSAKAELERAQRLQVAIAHRIPYAFRWVADNVNDVFVGAVLGKAMSVFGKDWAITGDRVKWAKELVDREAGVTFRDGVFQANHADTELVNASDATAMDYHRAGLMARKYSFRSLGWGEVEADGGAGLENWAKTLQLRFADPNSPAHSWVQTVQSLMRDADRGAHGTVDDFAATGEDLLHGTPHKFDKFSGDATLGNTGRGAGDRVYMTGDPKVAQRFAWESGGPGGAQQFDENFWHLAESGQLAGEGVTPELAAKLRDPGSGGGAPKQVEHDAVKPGMTLLVEPSDTGLRAVRNVTDSPATIERHVVRSVSKDEKGTGKSKVDQWHYQLDNGQVVTVTRPASKKTGGWPYVEDGADPTAAHAEVMKAFVRDRMAKGWTFGYEDADTLERHVVTTPAKLDKVDPWQLSGEGNAWMIPPGSTPRTVTAKVYGKTIDLRDPANIPAELKQRLEAEGRWTPWQAGSGSYDHERSRALTDWMREKGYGKARVNDAHTSGYESTIALPEMIGHGGNDPVKTYAKTLGQMSGEQWADVLDAARESVLRRLDDPEMRHFLGSAEVFRWYKGERIAKGDTEIEQLAKEEYADRVAADLTRALSGREGTGLNRALLDELAAGRVPDRSWLAGIPADERPSHALGQLWAPYNPAMQPGQITRGMTGMMTKAYDKVVTDQINALSRNPLVTALYMRARENTQGYVKNLIDEGFDPQIADDIGRRIAAQHAEVEAFKHIDNPYVSSQFSMLARNHFAFVRAQEDWLKRWGRTIKDNPELIRKAQLLIHGGESVGFLEQDDQGDLHFVYPGSGLLLGIFGSFFGLMNQPNGARIPQKKELSSTLTMLNPSLDNPIGFSGTPLVSLPWKAIAHFLGPDNALMSSSMDKVINGDLGAGREWWEQLLPSWANRIISGVMPKADMNSKYGAAIQSTLANMTAAGMLDDPKYQTAEGKAQLLHALQVGTHNDLLSTALFGFFAPASPTYDAKAASNAPGFQGTDADWSAHMEGLRSLKDEARQVFAQLPYEEAKAWWVAVHPNESILAPIGPGSRTQVGTDNASAPATVAAASYLEKHTDFFQGYGGPGGVAAYFIPQGQAGTVNGSYSDVAYRAQLELGIRDYKSLSDYFDDIVTARGYSQYFAAKDAYDAQKDRAGGSAALNAKADADWQTTRAGILAGSPLLAQKLAANAVDNAATSSTIQSLYKLVEDTSPATESALGVNRTGVKAMLAAKERLDEGTAALGDRRGNSANRRRNALKSAYNADIEQLSAQFPGLADLARGVFRTTS